MYEDIKKPALLKFIPMQLVRPLPSIYYYGKYENANENSRLKKFHDSNIEKRLTLTPCIVNAWFSR